MPDLTLQDRESYQKLYDAAFNLQSLLSPSNNQNLANLKILTSTFFTQFDLVKPVDLANFGQLQYQVELTGSYLIMYGLLAKDKDINSVADSPKKSDLNKHYQELLAQYNQLKVSLEAVDDDFLDNVAIPCSDPLFLKFLEGKEVKAWTQQLMNDQAPVLTDDQVQTLINAWGKAVTKFVEDARKKGEPEGKAVPGKSKTIAHFFCIHDQLEGLYSELSTAVALND